MILVMAISFCCCAVAPADTLTWNLWDDMVFNHEDPNSVNPTGPWTWGAAPKLADRNTPDTTGFFKCTDSFVQAGVPDCIAPKTGPSLPERRKPVQAPGQILRNRKRQCLPVSKEK